MDVGLNATIKCASQGMMFVILQTIVEIILMSRTVRKIINSDVVSRKDFVILGHGKETNGVSCHQLKVFKVSP
jgi:hypothetical protein